MSEWETVSSPDDGWETVAEPAAQPGMPPFFSPFSKDRTRSFLDAQVPPPIDAGKMIGNIPSSGMNIATGLYNAATSTEPWKLMGSAAKGAMSYIPSTGGIHEPYFSGLPKMLYDAGTALTGPATQQDRAAASAIGQHYANYFKPGGLGKALEENPVETAMELSMLSPAIKGLSATRGTSAIPRGDAFPIPPKIPLNPDLIRIADQSAKAGYVVPKQRLAMAQGKQEGPLGILRERFAGRESSDRVAQIKNTKVTDSLAKKELGIDDLSEAAIRAKRSEHYAPYAKARNAGEVRLDQSFLDKLDDINTRNRGVDPDFPARANPEVAKLIQGLKENPSNVKSSSIVDQIKDLREHAGLQMKNDTPEIRALGRAKKDIATAMEDLLQRQLEPKLGKTWVDDFRTARTKIAQSHVIEESLKEGHVSAKLVSKLGDKTELTGNLKTIADFYRMFERSAVPPSGPVHKGGWLELLGAGSGAGALGLSLGLDPITASLLGAGTIGVIRPWSQFRSAASPRFTPKPPFAPHAGLLGRGAAISGTLEDQYNQGLLGQQ